MMYVEWIIAALGAIVAYMLFGYLWAWWSERGSARQSEQRRAREHQPKNGEH